MEYYSSKFHYSLIRNRCKMKYSTKLLILLISLLFAFGCSEVQNDITPAPYTGVHPEGFGTPSSPDFHKFVFRNNDWGINLTECQQCHAADYSGGVTDVSCLGCHSQPAGPEACNTCHGVFANPDFIAPPNDLEDNSDIGSKGVGAHYSHVYNNSMSTNIGCFECHQQTTSEGKFVHTHISPPPAKMEFGEFTHPDSLAINPDSSGVPEYEFTDVTCSNTYCHGNFKFGNIEGNNNTVIWNSTTEIEAECGTCHGRIINDNLTPLPVGHFGSFGKTSCVNCHPSVVDADGEIIDKLKHINKQVDLQ